MVFKVPSIAVLMATYNGAQYLLEQLGSIDRQEDVKVTLFVSDDRSRDKTLELLKNNSCSTLDIKILPDLESSGGAGQNFFRLIQDVPLKDFEYFAFSDQDDVWLPHKLSRAISKLNEYSAQGYSSSIMACWQNGLNRFIKKDYPQKNYDYFFEGPGPGCTFVLTRSFFAELKTFVDAHKILLKDIYYHDWFIYAFARTRHLKWIIDDQSYIHYRQHHENDTGANIGLTAAVSRFKKIWGYWARDQIYANAKVLGYQNILHSYFASNFISSLRLVLGFLRFRRSTKDCFAVLLLGLAGRFKPPTMTNILKAQKGQK